MSKTPLLLLSQEDDGTWTLLHYANPRVESRHSRLIDAIYERQRLWSGEAPPFGRWIIYGVEEVEPLRLDGESDEQMQSDATMKRTLHLRDWEYEDLVDTALGRYQPADDNHSDEFETKFQVAVHQPSRTPSRDDSDASRIEANQDRRVDDEQEIPCAAGVKPFYKRHPIIFWTIIGALLTALGNGYTKYQMNEGIGAEQTGGK
jgi:hypothetical protein